MIVSFLKDQLNNFNGWKILPQGENQNNNNIWSRAGFMGWNMPPSQDFETWDVINLSIRLLAEHRF